MVEDEFRFGNIPAVMFVDVKGMKEVVRKGAVCLDNTFAGGGCLQGPVALTHQPNCPLCSFSFEIVGDVGCSCEIVKKLRAVYGVEGMAPAIYLRAIPWTLSSRLVLILFSTALIHTIEQ